MLNFFEYFSIIGFKSFFTAKPVIDLSFIIKRFFKFGCNFEISSKFFSISTSSATPETSLRGNLSNIVLL
jgi:hypothetical protein